MAIPNTVPKEITPRLRAFCETISPSEPSFIISVPVMGGIQSFCFENVERKIKKSGGSIVYGWAIWNLPSFYFEAEHHAVWHNKQGKLIDVSSQLEGRKRLLFLPDPNATYDPMCPKQSILCPDGETPAAIKSVELGNRRHSLFMRCRVPGTNEIRLFDADKIELA
jgi:hypothetical protein